MGREVTKHTITQTDLIFNHMKRYGSISQLEAVERYGCYRLSARIADLKSKGCIISKENVTKKNRYGHTTTYAKYSLEAEQ